MSERCRDTLECRPEDLRCALAIHTQKITDSCRDKDCIEDLRVYLTRESQAVLDTAAAAKVRSAELVYTSIDVSPVAFHRNHYTVDLTFYYKVIADAAVGPCRPAAICGLALFSKRAVLCGENTGAHIFRSDAPGTLSAALPAAVVEAIATNSQRFEVWTTDKINIRKTSCIIRLCLSVLFSKAPSLSFRGAERRTPGWPLLPLRGNSPSGNLLVRRTDFGCRCRRLPRPAASQ